MAVFQAADLLLPQAELLENWAVIACDQFTSQPEYWRGVRAQVGERPSALNIVFPEAELGKDEQARIDDEIGVTDLDDAVGGVLDDGAEARHAATDHVVRDQEDDPPHHVHRHAEGDQEILLHPDPEFLAIHVYVSFSNGRPS